MELKKASVWINFSMDYPIHTKIFERSKNQRLSTFIKSVRKWIFQTLKETDEDVYAIVVYEGDIGKIYEKITKNDVSKSNDFDMTKFKQLRAYRHEAREDKK